MAKPTAVPSQTPAHELLADEIQRVAQACQSLRAGRLNDRALYLLISHQAKVSASTVRLVLDAAARLDQTYLKPAKPGPGLGGAGTGGHR